MVACNSYSKIKGREYMDLGNFTYQRSLLLRTHAIIFSPHYIKGDYSTPNNWSNLNYPVLLANFITSIFNCMILSYFVRISVSIIISYNTITLFETIFEKFSRCEKYWFSILHSTFLFSSLCFLHFTKFRHGCFPFFRNIFLIIKLIFLYMVISREKG